MTLTLGCEPFATLPDGRSVTRWSFGSPDGVLVEVLDLGARLQSVHLPDRTGASADVLLSGSDAAALLGEARYFGATVGRYANRIADGRLPLDGLVHRLAVQPGGHTLHGGPGGFHSRCWEAEEVRDDDAVGVRFTLRSPYGDEGFPGELRVGVTYLLDAEGSLRISYTAVTDAPTVVNLTNHAYFNLAGEGAGDVRDHLLTVHAEAYLPVDAGLIPIGPPAPVGGTPFDLRSPARLGGLLSVDDPQLRLAGGGFDHNWVLRPGISGRLREAAVLSHPASGRWVECATTEPGLQVYTGNLFDGSLAGPSGRPYGAHAGVALETQHFPDSPNHRAYPSTVLRPGEEYRSTTVYRFGAGVRPEGRPGVRPRG